jgi:putative ABC transport system permease protein
VRERVQAIPGVESVAAIEFLPLSGSVITRRIAVEGQPIPNPGEEPIAQRHIVSPDYFRTMGIPLKSGRAFADADMRAEPLVALINESMARRYWPHRNPVGQHVRLGFQARVANAPAREIVGVVGDVRHASLRSDPRDEVYVPLGQEPWPATRLVLRSVINPEDLAHDLKNAIWAIDKNQPLPGLTTMTDVLAESVWEPRLNTLVMTLFASITLMLALAGIYGLMTRVVGDRTPEIGIRMALGARPALVLRLVLREGFAPVLLGTVAGLAMAIAGSRLIAAQLYGITGQDPVTFGAGVLIIVTAALLAMVFPALRAAKIDPMRALRHE